VTKEQAMVAAFHRKFGTPPPERPDLEHFPGELRVRLIQEESAEFAQAVAEGDLPEMVDALCDLLYVTYGAAVDLGVDLEPFFAAVHRTNMDKVGGHRRADGKWVKPAGWRPPDVAGLLQRLYDPPARTPSSMSSSIRARKAAV
jgi:predicted HAD superfamily Cof-like phosphohydrolase